MKMTIKHVSMAAFGAFVFLVWSFWCFVFCVVSLYYLGVCFLCFVTQVVSFGLFSLLGSTLWMFILDLLGMKSFQKSKESVNQDDSSIAFVASKLL